MTLEQAIVADRDGDLVVAASLYEQVIAEGNRSLPVLLGLAVLYWQATDPGLAARKQLGAEFLTIAGGRFPALIAEARARFPTNTEARFWEKYIAWAEVDEPFTIQEAWTLLRTDPTTLLPAVRILMLSNGKEARAEAIELREKCRADETVGARYVASVIDSMLGSGL